MSTAFSLPDESALTQPLMTLYGDATTVKSGGPVAASNNNPVAVFVDDGGTPVAACVCDPAFGAYAGSSLAMIPPGGASDAAESGQLSNPMIDTLRELMNIFSRLFMLGETPHLKLDTVYTNADQVPENAQAMIGSAAGRADFEVSFERYGSGAVSFLTT